MRKINPWMIISIVLVVVIIGLLIVEQGTFIFQSSQDIANKAIKYINENLVPQDTSVTFVSVSEFDDLYNVTFIYLGQNLSVFVTKDGSHIFLTEPLSIKGNLPEIPEQTIGNFVVDEKSEICKEDGKTIVYFFGSQKCPFCIWEEPIIKNVAENFKDQISFHENIDTDRDKETFLKYSSRGYIPLIVIGCRYYRIGSGEALGGEQEAKVLTALMCSLTNGNPLDVCIGVEDLINQIG